ncbi:MULTISPECIES: hypothetical protein [unclassified Mesorhizobium]|uniref:hypothetical protein n=1 Tax=unclassified Mesorhizobium TaxID=325217 RepID=UPI000F74E4A3|nr:MULTISPECIES: hypothetical protein [unclassified Mesorhizobium]AZO31446.1 hypothetical protein EJ071_31370 [Mesorhizobium sp. M1B.F.Ca.ET.045.04.1.1]RWA72605.1 MAG: hypothetical protein EOQ29_07490 [Mesorhizobium sp.]RWA78272.1 MAG: hypothetical protein EOQ30_30105 [Mesorhizobium sp.]RWB22831.1 MAG: hypothetical protein EOQ40_03780 [Mesorhizobium sp.]TIS50538.1 MAG: hypothetical protein E5W96_09665 [Mesorhizobium sp.]
MSDDTAIGRSLSEEIGYWLESASRTLEKRYGNGVPLAKQDILLAHYLYGLTAVVHAGDAPAVHLAAVRSYLGRLIPDERVARALQSVPEEGDSWLENTLDRVEAIGEKQGHALLARGAEIVIPFSSRNASAAGSAEPAVIERDPPKEAFSQ